MFDVEWIKRKRSGSKKVEKNADIKITYTEKSGVAIWFYNASIERFKKDDYGYYYLKFGFLRSDNDILVIESADCHTGYKVGKAEKYGNKPRVCRVSNSTLALARFVGEYNFEVSEDNEVFVNRRNAL